MKKKMTVEIQNVTEGKYKYVVARYCEDNKLWYWGRWKTKEEAESVAEEIGGVVVIDETAQEEPKEEHYCPFCKKKLTDFDLFMKWCPLCMKSIGEKE